MTYFNKQFSTKAGFSGNGANLTNVNAASVTGFLPSQTNTASTIAVRDSSGALVISTPTVANHATTKAYVDSAVDAIASGPVNVAIDRADRIATASQTSFAAPKSFTTSDIIYVYYNGVLLLPADYTLSSPNVILASPATVNDEITIIVITPSASTGGGTGGSTVTIEEQTTDTPTAYLSFVNSTTGAATTLKTNTGLTYTPSTNTVNASNFNSTSDRRLKDNIVPIGDALSVIGKLNGYEYDFKEHGNHAAGVIAQELEQVLPFAVSEVDGYKGVSYTQLIPYLIEGMKQQSELINKMQKQINELTGNV
jgi:hypothetical protein